MATALDLVVPHWLRLANNLIRRDILTGEEALLLPILLRELEKKSGGDLAWKFIDCATHCSKIIKILGCEQFVRWIDNEKFLPIAQIVKDQQNVHMDELRILGIGNLTRVFADDQQSCEFSRNAATIILKRYPDVMEEWLMQYCVETEPSLKPVIVQLDVNAIFAQAVKPVSSQEKRELPRNLNKNSQCAECGCKEISETMGQFRSGDEGMTMLFKCLNVKCNHTWQS